MSDSRILLVEDDETLREVIAEALREDGYDVQIAGDGAVALNLAERWQPNLLVLDLMMPNMNGEEFSVALRSLNGLASIPIIIVSASRFAQDVGNRIGAQAALAKPFDLFELTERVHDLLD
jgi:DNA-binding response OmpR family regulator